MSGPVSGPAPRDAGVSLVEVLVAVGLFGMLGTLLLGFALSTGEVADDVQRTAGLSEEARLAMERMTRELRQAEAVRGVALPASPGGATAITFWTDFDGDGAEDVVPTDPERLTYRWDPASGELTLTANEGSTIAETRPMADRVSSFVLGLRSSLWELDADGNGVTTWQEVDRAPGGNGNGQPDGAELTRIDLVEVSLRLREDGHTQGYVTEVDLRNRAVG